MATLVHDDLIDRAHASGGAAQQPGRRTGRWVRGRQAITCSRERFAELSATGDGPAVQLLAEAYAVASFEARLSARQTHHPETTVDEDLRPLLSEDRPSSSTPRVCSGAAASARRVRTRAGSPSRSPTTSSTAPASDRDREGRGVDLREGTPTLPLLLAAREDGVVHEALAGGPLDGALVRVAATGALEQAREVALRYAAEARWAFSPGAVTAPSSRR